MPYCPNGHGEKSGKFCDECPSQLVSQPPGDSLRIRSPEATATVHQHLYGLGATPLPANTAPQLLKCPRCGRRNPEHDSFDCQGACDRQNLCLKHFDEEYEVCADCAKSLRQTDKKAAEANAALHKEVADWRGRAERAERDLAALTQRHQQSESSRQQAAAKSETERSAGAERERSLAEQLAHWRARAESAEGQLPGLRQQLQSSQQTQGQTAKEREAARNEAARLGSEAANWKSRAEAAENELTAIRRREAEERKAIEREAEERKAAEREARQRAAAPALSPAAQKIGIELVKIPAGEFLYGDNKEKRTLEEFWIARTPVTNEQYKAFVDAARHRAPSHWENGHIPTGKEKHPVTYVDWNDAVAFCKWAGVRLPGEQEWEKAARGTDGRPWPWGNQEPDKTRCNFAKNVGDTTPVGQYPAGTNGLFDMAGNVWEWCADWFDGGQKYRVLRGGSWYTTISTYVRCACRYRNYPDYRDDNVGFRVVVGGGVPPRQLASD